MATHSSGLAWRIPGTGEPGGLPSMRLHRVGHDWSDLAAAAAAIVILMNISFVCIIFLIKRNLSYIIGFPDGSAVKNLPAMQETWETWVQSLGREDPLEEEMATYSKILAWRIPWTEEPGGLHPWGCRESDITERMSTHTSSYITNNWTFNTEVHVPWKQWLDGI